MKVAMDVAPVALNSAGERRYITSLLPALAAQPGVELSTLSLSRRRPRSTAQRIAWQAAAEGVYYPFLIGPKARRAGAEVVHHPRHLVPPELGLSAASVVTVHDVLPLLYPEFFSELIARRFGVLARLSTRAGDRVITGSAASAAAIAERLGVEAEKIRVTPYAVDTHFRPVEPDPELLERATGVSGPYVLCLGTLEPRKNLAGAVRAFERVQTAFPDHMLVVAGGRGWRDGALRELLDRAAVRLHLTGFVEDAHLPLLYSGAQCFLFPSFGEGFGFPVLEAMACGVPVVTSNNTSLPEVAGDAAVYADPRDDDDLAAALGRVLGDEGLRRSLSAAGLERASTFSWDACAALTADVYRELSS